MARDRSENTENTQEATAQAAAAAPAGDDRFKKVKLEDGTIVNRKDFINDCWKNKFMSRGDITRELNRLNSVEKGGDGKKIPYQVVFAVLKKGAEAYGGPTKNPNQPAAAASTAA